ncbi:MAG: hypothetical protein ACE5IE_04265 [Dehalococcoidia bacterium]
MAEGKRVDKALLEPALGDGMEAGVNQVRLNIKRLGPRWQEALSRTLEAVARDRLTLETSVLSGEWL